MTPEESYNMHAAEIDADTDAEIAEIEQAGLAICDHEECPKFQCNRLSNRPNESFIVNENMTTNAKPPTIDEVCNQPEGSFQEHLKRASAIIEAIPNLPESETPRTHGEAYSVNAEARYELTMPEDTTEVVDGRFARQLETELRSVYETLAVICEKLGVDLEAAQIAPSNPSDVIMGYIDRQREELRIAEEALRSVNNLVDNARNMARPSAFEMMVKDAHRVGIAALQKLEAIRK